MQPPAAAGAAVPVGLRRQLLSAWSQRMREVVSGTAAARCGCLQPVAGGAGGVASEVRDLMREVGKTFDEGISLLQPAAELGSLRAIQHPLYPYDVECRQLTRAAHLRCWRFARIDVPVY